MVGHIRITEDDSANTAETVNANKCFRHDCVWLYIKRRRKCVGIGKNWGQMACRYDVDDVAGKEIFGWVEASFWANAETDSTTKRYGPSRWVPNDLLSTTNHSSMVS